MICHEAKKLHPRRRSQNRRHPLYADFILLGIPGACLLANSWATLTAIPFAYLAFRRLIREEERSLIETFGDEYLQYKKIVNAVFPKFSSQTNPL